MPMKPLTYIVVGAGPGGGVVASRLAQAGFETLLLEAGPVYTEDATTIPIFWPIATEDPNIEWRFFSSNSVLDEGRDRVLYPRASMVGGCAGHNAMFALYTFPDTWEKLRAATGDNEFAEERMRARFVRIEKNEYGVGSKPGHGSDGFMSTSLPDLGLALKPRFLDPQLLAVIASLTIEDAIPRFFLKFWFSTPRWKLLIPDVNAPGMNSVQGTHLAPTAISPSNGYKRSGVMNLVFDTAASTNKLTLVNNSFVTKLLMTNDTETPTVFGVQVQEGECVYEVATCNRTLGNVVNYYAGKEVILAGGVFNTPQILMLSGIGSPEQLQEFQIPVAVNLPGVGSNLRDKLEATMNFRAKTDWRLLSQGCTYARPFPENDPCLMEYKNQEFPTPYQSNGGLTAIQRSTNPDVNYPDTYIQIAVNEFRGYNPGWVDLAYSEEAKNVLTINSNTPRYGPSTGTVKLKSANPFDSVEIDFNGYDDEDLERTANVVLELREWAKHMEKFGVLKGEFFPGPAVETLDEVKLWVRANGWGHHPLGTCKMGSDNDSMAVVNGQFQVRGVDNMRIVDASVFPDQPGFFPLVPIYMMAEKAAEDIIKANTTISAASLGC